MDKIDKQFSKLDFIQCFKKQLKTKDYDSTTTIAINTAEILLKIIKTKEYNNLDELSLIVKSVGKMFISVDLMQFSVGNIVKRILHFINEEKSKVYNNDDKKTNIITLNSLLSLANCSKEKENTSCKYDISIPSNTKMINLDSSIQNIISEIGYLLDSLRSTSSDINEQSDDHIINNDIILTSNYSGQLLEFLIQASKNKTFHVIVAESGPSMSGKQMANSLSKVGIKTTVIDDNSIFAIMPRVNKVIIGTRAVMANGGLISYNGVYNICLAAQTYSIPIVVVAGIFKLTPMYPFDHETFNEQLSPDKIYNCEYEGNIENITFNSPAYDYIPPEFITIFVTNEGSQNPSYIYRLFNENFSQQDYFL